LLIINYLSDLELNSAAPLRRIFTIQYLRAFAAIFVLLYHASLFVGQATGDNYFSAIFNGRFGVYGVALFFSISGYLMAELAQRADAATFLARVIGSIRYFGS
jgi:exopolysaccharide production protein ExoZ